MKQKNELHNHRKLKWVGIFAILSVVAVPLAYSATEPSVIINMIFGQTEKPLIIKDNLGSEIFSVDVDGTVFPAPVIPDSEPAYPVFRYSQLETKNVPLGQTSAFGEILLQLNITREVGLPSMQVHIQSVVLQAEVERTAGSFGTIIAFQSSDDNGATWNSKLSILKQVTPFEYDFEDAHRVRLSCLCTFDDGDVDTLRLVLYNFNALDEGNVRNIQFIVEMNMPVGYTVTQVI